MGLLDFSGPAEQRFCVMLYVGGIAEFPCLSSFTADVALFVAGIVFPCRANWIFLLEAIWSVAENLANVIRMLHIVEGHHNLCERMLTPGVGLGDVPLGA